MTLFEVVSAAVMVSVALVGTAGAVVTASALQETTTRKRMAARRAASLLADLRSSDMETLVANHDGTEHAIDVGGGRLATARVGVSMVAGSTTAAPVYRIEVRVAFPEGEGLDELRYVTHACSHSDLTPDGTAVASVVPPDGTMLDWVTDIEKKEKKRVASTTTYLVDSDDSLASGSPTYEYSAELDDGMTVVEYEGGGIEYEVLIYDSLTVEDATVYDALESLIIQDYQ